MSESIKRNREFRWDNKRICTQAEDRWLSSRGISIESFENMESESDEIKSDTEEEALTTTRHSEHNETKLADPIPLALLITHSLSPYIRSWILYFTSCSI